MPRGRSRKIQPQPKEEFDGGTRSSERLDKLPAIAAKIDTFKVKSDEARGDLGSVYKQAEDDGFHRRALKEAVKLRGMEPDKRRDYLASLNAYCDKLGIWDQGDLLDPEPHTPMLPDDEPTAEAFADSTAQATAEIAGFTYETGRQAGLGGKNGTENPWPAGTRAYTTWHEGWLNGQFELVGQTAATASG